MSPKQELIKNFNEADGVTATLVMEESRKRPVDETDRAIAEIEARANQIGVVLESILHEGRGNSRWGLNE